VVAAASAAAAAATAVVAVLAPGEEKIVGITLPLPLSLIFGTVPKPHIRLSLEHNFDTNKKLPPKTIFMSCKDGEMGPAKVGGASIRFAFEKTKSTLVH
jgi:hypothetical protein